MASKDMIERLVAAIRDETMSDAEARRYVRAALLSLQPGDRVSAALVVKGDDTDREMDDGASEGV